MALHLLGVQKADDLIEVGSGCTALKEFSLTQTRSKKVRLLAPFLERIYIDGNNGYEPGELEIAADTGYLLHLSRTVVHLEKCPGFGKLVIEDNWSGEKDPFTAEATTPNFYPHFHYFEGRGLAQWSNRFLHSFAITAPQLERLHIRFSETLRFEDDAADDVVHIRHPNVKWVNLLKGDAFFRAITIDKACTNLKLVKFRDFEIDEFNNQGNFRVWHEKNILDDKDF